MATETRCDLTRRLIPSPDANAGRRVSYYQYKHVVLRIEAVEPCDLHPEAIRAIVRDGTAVAGPDADVLPLRVVRSRQSYTPGGAS